MKTRLRRFAGISVIGLIIIGMCWGCAGVEQKFDDWQSAIREKLNFNSSGNGDAKDGNDGYFRHTTQWPWETMDHVAAWYTGNAKNSGQLSEINPSLNPNKLAVGSEVLIPTSWVKTREPMPNNFSGKYHENYYKHTVRWPGETLSLIASWYTGSSRNWRKLAEANPRLNPNRIKGGNVIMIPPALLKTRVPLPQKVAAKYTSHYFAHKVEQNNEKLEDIARWYTGDPSNYKLLAKVNPDLSPDQLKKGNEVYIPQKLLKTRKPLRNPPPAASLSKPVARTPMIQPKKPDTEDENIQLFGPKQFPKGD